MRQTLDNAGTPLATASYDPWGTPQSSAIAPFGFTGEIQDAQGLTYLRARWYDAGAGRFHSRDPFAGWPETPYSTHYYQYAYSNPINWTDPSGRCVGWLWGSEECQFAGFDPRNWNYADGAAYATGVASNVVDPVVGVYTLATSGAAREAVWQQLQNVRPSDIPGIVVDGVTEPFRNIYYGLVCDDSYLLGKGAGGVGIEVIGAAAGISAGRRATQAGTAANPVSTGGIRWLGRPGFLRFQGFEVRGVRDLSHISEGTLRAMKERGFAATDINGDRLILHHLYQNPDGSLVEIPTPRHSIGNRAQHPYGNMEGMGLTPEERALFNEWRTEYWKTRAAEELVRRGIE